MKTINHSKYKNSGLLFELLTRQITVDLLNERESSPAVDIIKKYFGGSTELSKEYSLYNALMKENFSSENKAESFLEEIINRRKALNEKKLSKEKYNLVGDIKESYPIDDFFQSRIDNYTELASVYKVFKYITEEEQDQYDPADAVRSKYTILEHITREPSNTDNNKSKEQKVKSEVLENYRKQSRDLRVLAQKIMIEKFNEKYGSLLPEQRNLLKKYINNISNTNSLRDYVNEEVDKVKSELQSCVDEINEESTRIKVKETLNLMEELKRGNIVRDDQVSSLLMYYQLLDEIKSNVSDEENKEVV